jgi:hypothetical protein
MFINNNFNIFVFNYLMDYEDKIQCTKGTMLNKFFT